MIIKLKLFAMLQDRLPPGSKDHTMELEVPAGATPAQVVTQMQIPEEMAHLVLLDGRHLTREEREHMALHEGDVLSIFPPIAGG